MSICLRSILTSRSLALTSLQPLHHSRLLLQLPQCRTPLTLMTTRDMSGKRLFIIHPTRFVWRRWKKDMHLFIMLAVIPLTGFTLYMNLTQGPAVLTEIPPGYFPKEHEFYKNAVTRFLAKNVATNQQKGYEQLLQLMHEEGDKIRIRRLEQKVNALQGERMDYQGYYHQRGPTTKFLEEHRESSDDFVQEKKDPFVTY